MLVVSQKTESYNNDIINSKNSIKNDSASGGSAEQIKPIHSILKSINYEWENWMLQSGKIPITEFWKQNSW